jgi:hypothetical protein
MSIHQTIQIQSKRIAEWVMMTKNKKTSSPVHIEQYFIARAHIVQKYNPKRHLTEKYPRAVFISSKQQALFATKIFVFIYSEFYNP